MQHTFVTYDSTQNYCRRHFHGGVNTLKLFQLLSNYIDVTDSLRPSLTGCLAVSTISPLFVDRFGRSLLLCYLEFDNEAISDGFMAYFRDLRKINSYLFHNSINWGRAALRRFHLIPLLNVLYYLSEGDAGVRYSPERINLPEKHPETPHVRLVGKL